MMTSVVLPENACDCHFHVFDPRFPFARDAILRPGPASLRQYREVSRKAGLRRGVIVQPSSYGLDNRCLLEALGECGPDARGIAVVDDNVSLSELQQLHECGVRGVRFNLVQPGATTVEMLLPVSRLVKQLDWHLQLHFSARQIVALRGLLMSLQIPLVFDHSGRVSNDGDGREAWGVLKRLIDEGRTWIKLSAPYLNSTDTSGNCEDALQVNRELLGFAPERMVWGSDWPHVTEAANTPKFNDLLEHLFKCSDDREIIRQVLVENPAYLYRF